MVHTFTIVAKSLPVEVDYDESGSVAKQNTSGAPHQGELLQRERESALKYWCGALFMALIREKGEKWAFFSAPATNSFSDYLCIFMTGAASDNMQLKVVYCATREALAVHLIWACDKTEKLV